MDANDRRARAAEEAAEWWVTLQGEVSRAEREQYIDWLRESGLHVAEMLRIARVHGALAAFERWSKLPTDGPKGDEDAIVTLPGPDSGSGPPPPNPPTRMPRRRLALALAAAVVFVAVGLGVTFLAMRQGQVIEAARGERREVALADGSTVQVDPESRLRIEYEPTRRLVFLERGRALFHVAKNRERPFLVTADDTTVRAVGTAFAVDKERESVVVTVAEGRVAVVPIALHSAPPANVAGSPLVERAPLRNGTRSLQRSSTGGNDEAGAAQAARAASGSTVRSDEPTQGADSEILLGAGEQVVVDAAGRAEPVHRVDASHALAWAEGRLVFDDAPVERVVEEFNRYNRVQLVVRDPELARRPISGTFSAADPESFVGFLETVTAVRVVKDPQGNTIIAASR